MALRPPVGQAQAPATAPAAEHGSGLGGTGVVAGVGPAPGMLASGGGGGVALLDPVGGGGGAGSFPGDVLGGILGGLGGSSSGDLGSLPGVAGTPGSGGRAGTAGGGASGSPDGAGSDGGLAVASGGTFAAPGGGSGAGNDGGSGGSVGPPGSGGTAGAATGAGGAGLGGSSGPGSGTAGAGGAPRPGPDDGDGTFTIGPTFTSSPDLAMKNVPHGMVFNFTLNSSTSNVFPGTDAVLNVPRTFTRAIRVYVPSQYVDGTAAPFMVSQDGFYAPLQTALDNLVVDPSPARRVPPFVIIGVAAGGGDGPGSERGLEYDTVSDRYWRYITSEVLPAVLGHPPLRAAYPNFKLTSNPDGRAAYGCSSGASAAFGLGWFGDFSRLLTFSGTFVDLQRADAATEAAYPEGAWEYPSMVLGAPAKPLRVFLEVGQNDDGASTPESQHLNSVIANRNLAAALASKGYPYRFVYALGAGRCDDRARGEVVPDALVWVWRGYPSN